ncbi:MAG: hypothetical protein WC966_11015 [Bradymonadales bacterium]
MDYLQDTVTCCGTGCKDCTSLPNSTSGRCDAGVCYVNGCVNGYTSNNTICCPNRCNGVVKKDWSTSCHYECNAGYEDCNDNCVDTSTNLAHCGGCNKICRSGECLGGECYNCSNLGCPDNMYCCEYDGRYECQFGACH